MTQVWALDLDGDFEAQGERRTHPPTEGCGHEIDQTGIDGVAPTIRAWTAAGGGLALDRRFMLSETAVGEPDEIYFRFKVWVPSSLIAQVDNAHGKMSGIGGTHDGNVNGIAWGGARYDDSAWSTRCLFGFGGRVGTYSYSPTPVGSNYPYGYGQWSGVWSAGWNEVLTHVRLNTPGVSDGVLRQWLNGDLVVRRGDYQWRDADHPNLAVTALMIHHGIDLATPGFDPAAYEVHFSGFELLEA